MKKTFVSILALLLALTVLFASCGGSNPPAETTAEPVVTTAEPDVTTADPSTTAGETTEPESPEVTADAKAALEKALEALDGASYEPVALLGTQVVSGTNYLMLCKIHMITANASPDDFHYSFVTVYQDLEGDASIIETKDIGASDEESGAEPEPVEYDAISDSSQAE